MCLVTAVEDRGYANKTPLYLYPFAHAKILIERGSHHLPKLKSQNIKGYDVWYTDRHAKSLTGDLIGGIIHKRHFIARELLIGNPPGNLNYPCHFPAFGSSITFLAATTATGLDSSHKIFSLPSSRSL